MPVNSWSHVIVGSEKRGGTLSVMLPQSEGRIWRSFDERSLFWLLIPLEERELKNRGASIGSNRSPFLDIHSTVIVNVVIRIAHGGELANDQICGIWFWWRTCPSQVHRRQLPRLLYTSWSTIFSVFCHRSCGSWDQKKNIIRTSSNSRIDRIDVITFLQNFIHMHELWILAGILIDPIPNSGRVI